jgi:hypothetical protein
MLSDNGEPSSPQGSRKCLSSGPREAEHDVALRVHDVDITFVIPPLKLEPIISLLIRSMRQR